MKKIEPMVVERITSKAFHQPFVSEYTSVLKRILNSPNGSVLDTMVGDLYKRIEELENELWCADCEDVFIVSQTCSNGEWNKIVKSQNIWWYSEKEAQEWLDEQEDWFRASNKVFSVRMELRDIKRVLA